MTATIKTNWLGLAFFASTLACNVGLFYFASWLMPQHAMALRDLLQLFLGLTIVTQCVKELLA